MRGRITIAGLGLAIVALFVGGILYLTRGSHIQIQGSIQKVRLQTLADNATLMVIDFRFVNPADYPFVVRSIDVYLQDKDGNEVQGMVSSEADLQSVFDYYATLGPKYNPTFKIREQVAPKESMDRMLAARFEMPEADVAARTGLRIRVEEVDGAVSEIVEERP